MRKKFISLFILIVFLVGCTSTTSSPPDPTAIPISTPTPVDDVIKLVTGEWAPFTEEALPEGGIAIRMVKLVFSEMGREVQIDFKPWERTLEETKVNIYFATFPWSLTEEKKQIFLFSDAILRTKTNFFVKANSDIEFTTIEDLTGRTICRPQEWNLFGLEEMVNAGKIKLETPNDMESCFLMLQAGRVDMTFDDQLVQLKLIENLFGTTDDFKMLDKPLDVTEYYLLVSKTYPQGEQLLTEFNQALAKLKAEGKIEAIINEY